MSVLLWVLSLIKALLHHSQGGRLPRTSARATHSVKALLQWEPCLVATILQRHREVTKEKVSQPGWWNRRCSPPPTLT